MKFITVSELKLKATEIISEIERTGKPMIVTKRGKPTALLRAVKESELNLKEGKGGIR